MPGGFGQMHNMHSTLFCSQSTLAASTSAQFTDSKLLPLLSHHSGIQTTLGIFSPPPSKVCVEALPFAQQDSLLIASLALHSRVQMNDNPCLAYVCVHSHRNTQLQSAHQKCGSSAPHEPRPDLFVASECKVLFSSASQSPTNPPSHPASPSIIKNFISQPFQPLFATYHH